MRAVRVAVVLTGLVLLGLGLVAASNSHVLDASGDDAAKRQPRRILFVGNSLTATNDLPAAVQALARANGDELDVEAVAPGGVNLEDHWHGTGARATLEAGSWDVVVLQQGPSSLAESRTHLADWARRWSGAARAQGGETALFMVWPEAVRSSAFPAVEASYRGAATASGSLLLPAGTAWRAAWRESPALALYGDDGFHPSILGTRLAALVVYAGLSGRDVAALTVPEPHAGVLRRAAAQALSTVASPNG